MLEYIMNLMKFESVNLFIDFDSTISGVEAIDELARIVSERTGDNKLPENVAKITTQGMRGEIDFHESVTSRLAMLDFNQSDVNELIRVIKQNFSQSFLETAPKLAKYAKLYLISGGFREFIAPALEDLNVEFEELLVGENFFSEDKGYIRVIEDKAAAVSALNLPDKSVMIGDGYTDYLVKEAGAVQIFVAYTEFIRREKVIHKADYVAENFRQVLDLLV